MHQTVTIWHFDEESEEWQKSIWKNASVYKAFGQTSDSGSKSAGVKNNSKIKVRIFTTSDVTISEGDYIYLGYDKEEKAIYQCTFYNADYPEKTIPFYSFPKGEVMMHLSLQASELTQAYEEGKLKGKLKEIASTLNEDSNAVIMLIKHRKN